MWTYLVHPFTRTSNVSGQVTTNIIVEGFSRANKVVLVFKQLSFSVNTLYRCISSVFDFIWWHSIWDHSQFSKIIHLMPSIHLFHRLNQCRCFMHVKNSFFIFHKHSRRLLRFSVSASLLSTNHFKNSWTNFTSSSISCYWSIRLVDPKSFKPTAAAMSTKGVSQHREAPGTNPCQNRCHRLNYGAI